MSLFNHERIESITPPEQPPCLLKKFQHVKEEYVKAFKLKLVEICRKLGDELVEIARELKAQGMQFSDLGLSNDGQYIVRSIDMVAANPTSEFADNIFADAKRLKCENCNGKCEEITLLTMRGFDVYTVDKSGNIGIPEPPPPQPKSPNQPFMPTRNNQIEASPERYNQRRVDGKERGVSFLNREEVGE